MMRAFPFLFFSVHRDCRKSCPNRKKKHFSSSLHFYLYIFSSFHLHLCYITIGLKLSPWASTISVLASHSTLWPDGGSHGLPQAFPQPSLALFSESSQAQPHVPHNPRACPGLPPVPPNSFLQPLRIPRKSIYKSPRSLVGHMVNLFHQAHYQRCCILSNFPPSTD